MNPEEIEQRVNNILEAALGAENVLPIAQKREEEISYLGSQIVWMGLLNNAFFSMYARSLYLLGYCDALNSLQGGSLFDIWDDDEES